LSDARDELVARVERNHAEVRDRIRSAGRDPDEVGIVAVVKGHGDDVVAAAIAAGLTELGDNYANELVAHHDATTGEAVAWHFLGALQRNKLARLATRVDVYESVASSDDAAAVARRAEGARCYVQVEVTGLPGRAGCPLEVAPEVVASARAAGLSVLGLMCVASPEPDRAESEFRAVRLAADALGLAGCSMGMSGDLEAACRAGTTALRLGTALFGPRPPRGHPGLA
jgi:uncharacterized pyridoxal phosphate-containing UPF0001 family protein